MVRPTLAAALALTLAGAVPAAAQSAVYTLPKTTVNATVAATGEVTVVEDHTFHFTDDGHGAYVDIPNTSWSQVQGVTVSEGGTMYREEGAPELGVDRPAGTFAQKSCGDVQRVVWYFTAAPDTDRVFRLTYSFKGVITAYDKHAFLHLPVWGKNWDPSLSRLEVSVQLPRPASGKKDTFAAFSQPADTLKPVIVGNKQLATASAQDVPGGRSVALDVAFPSSQLTLSANAAARSVVREKSGSGAEDLKSLRAGEQLVDTDSGSPCSTSETAAASSDSDSNSSLAVLFFIGVVVAAIIWLATRFSGGGGGGSSNYRRRRRSYSSGYSGGSSSSSSGGGDGGGGGGGGGGAW